MLRRDFLSFKEPDVRTLASNWEGLHHIFKGLRIRTYKIDKDIFLLCFSSINTFTFIIS